jgi:TonB family protein
MSKHDFTMAENAGRGLAAAAPLLSAGVGCLAVLVGIPAALPPGWPRTATVWALLAAAVVCAIAMTPILWRGIRSGRLGLSVMLVLALAPWVLGVVLASVQLGPGLLALARGASRSQSAYAGTPQQARLVGALLSANLLGASAAALAIASFLWRGPGARWRPAGLALLGAMPFVAFVAWGVARDAWGPLAAGFAGTAFFAMPLWLALAGAALGDSPRSHPGRQWAVGVPLAYLLWALAATTMVTGLAALDALAGLSMVRTPPVELMGAARHDIASAGWVRLVAVVLAALPLVVLAKRVQGAEWLSPARTWGRVGLTGVALLVTLDVVLGAQPMRQLDELATGQLAPNVSTSPGAEDAALAPVEVVPEAEPGEGLDQGVGESVSPPPMRAVRVGGQIKELEKLRDVPPVYPVLAQQARVQGAVILEITISPQGRVTEAKVLRGHPLFHDAALEAVRQWVYAPLELNGEPVPAIMTVTVDFKLR